MSSLQNILNPERKRSVKLLVIPPTQSSSTWDPPSHPSPGSSSEEEASDYNLHIPHPDCPDSLACLPDTDGRPQHTLPVILRCAILGAPRKRLTIREIYAAMEEKYAYYRTAGQTWKQSVRHHLSLNRLFERQPRPATDPGFGSYWTVNLAAPPGTKRPRKRGRPNKDGQPQQKKDVPIPVPAPVPVEEPASRATKPRRGRPPKEDSPMPMPVDAESSMPVEDDEEADMQMYEDRDDELVDELEASDPEDECESEEKPQVLHPFERRHSLPSLTPYDSSGGYHVSPEPQPPSYDTDDIIERLQMEMANLRRQSADAHNASVQLSEELTRARSETSTAQAALATSEMKLRDEINKRRQAERAAEEAVKLRIAAEEALNSFRFQMSDAPRNPSPR